MKKRTFVIGAPLHVYFLARDGCVLFYRTTDRLSFYSVLAVLAKRFGAGKPEELRRAAGSICLLAVLLGAAMTALFLPAARPLLLFLNCPPEVLEDVISARLS